MVQGGGPAARREWFILAGAGAAAPSAVPCTSLLTGEEERHVLYEDLFGISRGSWLYLEDAVFEGMHPESGAGLVGAIHWVDTRRGRPGVCGRRASPLDTWRGGQPDGSRGATASTSSRRWNSTAGTSTGLPSRRGDWKEAAGIARDAAGSADSELDTNAAWAATYGHRDEEVLEAGEGGRPCLAAGLTVSSRGLPERPAHPPALAAVERARMEAWRRR